MAPGSLPHAVQNAFVFGTVLVVPSLFRVGDDHLLSFFALSKLLQPVLDVVKVCVCFKIIRLYKVFFVCAL